jgi:hypothetical protein
MGKISGDLGELVPGFTTYFIARESGGVAGGIV